MEKTKQIIIFFLLALVGGLLILSWGFTADAVSEESKRIWELEVQINELRTLKEKCFLEKFGDDIEFASKNDLTVRYCYDWDEPIMALREETDRLKHKMYMGLE